MRPLLVFLLILVLAWRWRTWREARQQEKQRQNPSQAGSTTAMLACRQCGVHVPAQDAVVGRLGTYCCAAHQMQMEP